MAELGCVRTRVTGGFVSEPLKGLRGVGTYLDRLGWCGSTPWPYPIPAYAEAEQSEEEACVETQVVSQVLPLPS
jgi:hypothetical protein